MFFHEPPQHRSHPGERCLDMTTPTSLSSWWTMLRHDHPYIALILVNDVKTWPPQHRSHPGERCLDMTTPTSLSSWWAMFRHDRPYIALILVSDVLTWLPLHYTISKRNGRTLHMQFINIYSTLYNRHNFW